MDCGPPSFSVHGIFQARILEWTAISYSNGSSQSRDQILVSVSPELSGRLFTTVLLGKATIPQLKKQKKKKKLGLIKDVIGKNKT